MNIVNSINVFLLALYRSKTLRIIVFFVLLLLMCAVLGYKLAPSYLAKTIKESYLQATGHQLNIGKISFSLPDATLSFSHVADSKNLWQLDNVFIDVAFIASVRQKNLILNDLRIDKFTAKPQQFENGQWNFNDVLTHFTSTHKNRPAHESAAKGLPVIIKKINVVNASIHSNVFALNNLPLNITPLNLTVSHLDLRENTFFNFLLKADINNTIPLAINGRVILQSLQAELDVDIRAVPVVLANAALQPYLALEVQEGLIGTHSHVSINNGVLTTINSSGNLTDLKLRPANIEQDVVKLKRIEWNDLVVNLSEKKLHAPLVSLNEFDGQFIIYKDRSNNIQSLLIPQKTPDVATAAIKKTPPVETAVDSTPWHFAVDRVAINNAALGFYDQSLTPSFTVIVQQFTGNILNISSDDQQLAQIDLRGNVDGTAPVTLSGKAKPFMAVPQIDVLFSFKKIDMGALTPYSSEYAGWRINQGLMSVDLNYSYEQGKIIGKNHVVIEHLVFGEKVRSPHLIDIPLRLGLAMLTDENGVAVLDAEISGDPKNPKFNLREVIMRALRNTVKKIITSPFRFLSNLLHSNEDLERIEFTAGESQLSEQAISKLKLLNEALMKRPSMYLTIQGIYDMDADQQALKVEQMNSALQKQGVTAAALRDHDSQWVKAVETYYQSQGLTPMTNSIDDKYQELVAQQVVSQERLNILAHERALAAKQYFVLQLGAASEKFFLNSDVACGKSVKCSGRDVVFTLKH